MDLKRLSQIRIEEVRDQAIRRYFGFIVGALVVLVSVGVVLGIRGFGETTEGKRPIGPSWILAAMSALFIFRVWNRKKILDAKPGRPRAPRPGSPLPFHLGVTDFEPPDDREWAGRRIEFSSGIKVVDRWIWTLIALAVCGLLGYVHWSLREDTKLLDPANLPAAFLALVPLACLGWAIAGTLRHRQMGLSVFQIDGLPTIGRPLCGVFELPASAPLQGGLKIELLCLRQDDEGECVLDRTLAQKEQMVFGNQATVQHRLEIRSPFPFHRIACQPG